MDSIADVLAYVRSRAAAQRAGEWIDIEQVFVTRLRERRFPTRQELDEAAPHNPVLFRTGPDAAVNSLALQLSGIDRDFKITDGQAGQVERDPHTGEPTGILRNCRRFVKCRLTERTPTDADRRQRLRALLAAYNEVGITSVTDRMTSDADLDLWRTMKDRGELTCRIRLPTSSTPNCRGSNWKPRSVTPPSIRCTATTPCSGCMGSRSSWMAACSPVAPTCASPGA